MGAGAALSGPGAFEGATVGVVGVAAGGVSSVQPDTITSVRARLDSIERALIPNLTVTDALLEKHVTRPIIPSSISQSPHAAGPYVPGTIRETIVPYFVGGRL
jgi:hypothetical protein